MKEKTKCVQCGQVLKPSWKPCRNCGTPPSAQKPQSKKGSSAKAADLPSAFVERPSVAPDEKGSDPSALAGSVPEQESEPAHLPRPGESPEDSSVPAQIPAPEPESETPPTWRKHPPAPAPPPSFAEPAHFESALVEDPTPCEWCGSTEIQRYDDHTARCPHCRRSFQWA